MKTPSIFAVIGGSYDARRLTFRADAFPMAPFDADPFFLREAGLVPTPKCPKYRLTIEGATLPADFAALFFAAPAFALAVLTLSTAFLAFTRLIEPDLAALVNALFGTIALNGGLVPVIPQSSPQLVAPSSA